MANVPGLIITLRSTCVDVRRKRQEGNVPATNINSPIPSIPSLLCLHSWHSPICRTHFIPAHLRQSYIASRFPYSCQNSLMALNFQLEENWSGLSSYLHLFYISHSRLSELFFMGGSFVLVHTSGCLNTTRITHIVLCYVNCSNIMQNHYVNFWTLSDVLSQSGFCFKKKKKGSLQFFEIRENASEEERCILPMYFTTIIVPDAIKKKKSLQQRQSSWNWQLCVVVHGYCRFSCLRRIGLGTNVQTTERMKWDILQNS